MKLHIDNVLNDLSFNKKEMQEIINKNHLKIHYEEKETNYLGWVDLPFLYSKEDILRINKVAEKIRKNNDVLVVIGIGGSYLGAKAALKFLDKPFKKDGIEIIFAGHNVSGRYFSYLLDYLKDKDFSVNVISKSGSTTEPAIAFRILKNELMKKYKEKYNERIIATTDAKKGILYTIAKDEKFEMFTIPDDIGGRFSFLTPVGLLPLAVKGYDIEKLLDGAKEIHSESKSADIDTNIAYKYALTRYLLYKSGKKIEMLINYEPNLMYFAEWWKQLFAESEGKNNQGLFPASANFPTDLHSIGQYIQQGERHLFETVIKIKDIKEDVIIPNEELNEDHLNYLSGRSLKYVSDRALDGAMMAHVAGEVPNILVEIDSINEKSFGELIYFFELSCAMSAYLLDVNPFDQPGVEDYKNKMFELLGKYK